MADGFEVHPQAIADYARVVADQVQRLEQVQSTLSAVPVASSWFGLLPNSDSMYSQYQAHAQAEVENTGQMAELLQGVAELLQVSADAYLAAESTHVEAFSAIAGSGRGN